MSDDTIILIDHSGRKIRLTDERRQHILEHPEMSNQFDRLKETIQSPETIVSTTADDTVQVYHRYYEITPVTSKFLLVVVKVVDDDAFILTAFFSRREKKGTVIWKA
jgi:heme A synthase